MIYLKNKNVKMFIILLIASFSNHTILLAEVSVTHRFHEATISADSCYELSQEIKAIKSLSGYNKLNSESFFNTHGSNRHCSANASLLLPPKLAKMNNRKALISGPNCWNFALKSVGAMSSLRYATAEEVDSLLNSPLCEMIERENTIPGDLGFITDSLGQQVHAYIFITDNLLFAKHGNSSRDSYKLMTTKDMLKQYSRTQHCRAKNLHHKNCYNQTQYYRCNSFKSYIKEINLNQRAPKIYEFFTIIEQIEKAIEPLVINKKFIIRNLPKKAPEESPAYKEIAVILKNSNVLAEKLLNFKEYDTFSNSNLNSLQKSFLMSSAMARLESITHSSHHLLLKTSIRRGLDKSLFIKLKSSLKNFSNQNQWGLTITEP